MSIQNNKADWSTAPTWATKFGITTYSVGALLWCNDTHYLYLDPKFNRDDNSPYEFSQGILELTQIRILEVRIDEADYTPADATLTWPVDRKPVVGDEAIYTAGKRRQAARIKYVSDHLVVIEVDDCGRPYEVSIREEAWQQVLTPKRHRAHHEIDTMINLVDAGGLNRGQYQFLEYFCEVLIENGYGVRLTREETGMLVRSQLKAMTQKPDTIYNDYDTWLDIATTRMVQALGYNVEGLLYAKPE